MGSMQHRALLRIACSVNRVTARAAAIDVEYVGKVASERQSLSRLTKISLGTILRWHRRRLLTGERRGSRFLYWPDSGYKLVGIN